MKIIITTVTATLGIVFLSGYLFLNSILGVFGLVATTAETFSQMQAAQQTVKKMKARHKQKKGKVLKIGKGKRI